MPEFKKDASSTNGHDGVRPAGAGIRRTDVAIVGGGIGGSLVAAMLGKAGIDAVLIDIHKDFPRDFRCEKLDAGQIAILNKTGLTDAVFRASTSAPTLTVVRMGLVREKKNNGERYFYYDDLVTAVRGEIPGSVDFVEGRVDGISTSPDRQNVTLSNGEVISARLVVLANGLNHGLRQSLGVGHEILSACHSLSIGFDLKPVGRKRFPFSALTYFPENTRDKIAYLTLFPIGEVMRANFFVFHDLKDPWVQKLKDEPEKTLFEAMPGLRRFTGDFEIPEKIKVRPIDLYVSKNFIQPGMVLVGDAYSTSCPAAGTGVTKALVDAERLCNHLIPGWLATDGMGAEKIARYYDDPVKLENEDACLKKAFKLRAQTLRASPFWVARHWAVSLAHAGASAMRRG